MAGPSKKTEPPELNSVRAHALFDILTHHETAREISAFKLPGTVEGFGPPFSSILAAETNSPILHRLMHTLLLPLPGVSRLSTAEVARAAVDPAEDMPSVKGTSKNGAEERFFWPDLAGGLLSRLASANLSESYDKAALGTRRTLATGYAAVVEGLARGLLGGVNPGGGEGGSKDNSSSYDVTKADDLERGWDDLVRGLVYGDLIDELAGWMTETEDAEGHSEMVAAAAEYSIIHLAALLHRVFVVSPEGPYLIKLIEGVNRLTPYSMIKQTLRVSNAATMISGMMKLFLAKLSLTSLSNWAGLTQSPDDGMNLLQRIISAILGWDASDFRRTADKIERAKDAPPTAVLAAIQSYVSQPRSAQEQLRALSAERGISIVTAILESSPDTSISNISLNESHHTKCLDYLSALLSARDRDEITSVLCRTSPDLFTQAVREGFAAFDPLIRSVHVAIDLKVYVETTRAFVDDFLSVVKRGSTSNGSGNGIGTGNTNLNGTGNAGSGVVGNMIGNVITIANGKGIRNDKVKEAIAVPPSVADFAALLRRHKHVTYRWCHELCSRCPEIREQYVAYAKSLASEFRHSRPNNSTSTVATPSVAGAGAMGESLIELFSSLPSDKQVAVSSALGEHARYLASLRGWSRARMQAVLDEQKNVNRNGTGDSDKQQQLLTAAPGPGIYLAKWQALLCETAVTPAGGGGGLRFGRDIVGRSTKSYGGKTGPASPAAGEAQEAVSSVPDTAPQIEVVVDALAGQWRDLLLRAEGAGIGRTGRQWQTDDGHRNRS